MSINPSEIVNVLITLVLLSAMIQRRDVVTLLLILFVYGTLHFAYAAVALASHDAADLLGIMHTEGSGVLAKASAMTVLLVSFLFLFRHASTGFLSSVNTGRKLVYWFALFTFILWFGYLGNIRPGDWVQLRNMLAIEAIIAFTFVGYLAISGCRPLNLPQANILRMAGIMLFLAIDALALYEVYSGRSWAGTQESSGVMVYRASSLLFNPNLFGFWVSLVYIACAYGMHAIPLQRKFMLLGMVLAAIALYLSGSRSSGYLLWGVLFIAAILIKERWRWLPLLVLPATMLFIYIASAWLIPAFISGSAGWHSIALLGERFAEAPFYLLSYILKLSGIPAEILVSIEGRFTGDRKDAGWLVLYQDAGWAGLAGVIGISGMLMVWSLRSYLIQPGHASAYALAMLLYCVLIGFVMRFQTFPAWLFIGLVLIPCVVLWRQSAAGQVSYAGS